MIKSFCMILSLISLSFSAYADVFQSETEAKQFSENVMTQIAKNDLHAAFELMKPYMVDVVVPKSEFEDLALQTKAQREQFGARYGQSIGYEIIDEKKAGESILRLIYIEKTTKHAIPWVFFFYKSPDGWLLNSFFWSDQIRNAFQH